MKVATHLSKHPKIEWVRYPGLSRDPMHRLQKTYLKGKGLCGNRPLRRVHRQFFTKSFLGDDAPSWLGRAARNRIATPSSRRRVDGVNAP